REVGPVNRTPTRWRAIAVDGSAARSAPRWLARLGWSGWLVTGTVVGFGAAVVAGAVAVAVLAPVIIAVLLAVVLAPLVSRLCRYRLSRGWAVAVATLVPLVVVVLL